MGSCNFSIFEGVKMKFKQTKDYTIDYFVELKKILEILNLVVNINTKTEVSPCVLDGSIVFLLGEILKLLDERIRTVRTIFEKLGEIEKVMVIE